MISQSKKLKTREEVIDLVAEKFMKQGMPKHCGECGKLNACSKTDPEKICMWLKASKLILARFKALLLVFFLWVSTGVLPVNCFAAAPALGTIVPSSGIGSANVSQIFTTTFSDADGWQNIQYVYFQINSQTNGTNCFYGYYNQNLNKLYLRNDANSAWVGGYAPGSSSTIENSYARLNCAATIVTGSGTALTVKWSVTLKQPFTGAKKTYLYIRDDANLYVNWTQKGTWTLPNIVPQLGAVSPSFGASIPNNTFKITATYTDANTWQNIQYPHFLINTSAVGANCIYTHYNRDTNRMYLRNDANTAWVGGFSPGSGYTVENSYAKLNFASSSVSGSGNTLTIKWSITFKSAFLGTKNVYLNMSDYAGASTGWVKKGAWTALDSGVVIGAAGGQVISSDAKVRLIVPSGALGDPTAINISTVPKDALIGALPQGSSLLNAVDCKPYGLNFNVPVDIVYTLPQAEVPGTSVELGLYDSAQNMIIPTGQVSIVPEDGSTVTCPVTHFSTYVALKNLTPQAAPIGSGVKIPLPDMFTGAFGHSIPIAVSPGRKGVQPAIGLSYRSGSPNSWVGCGVSLNPGYIVRSTRLGPPLYDDTKDTFYFMTDAGTTELVRLIDNLYQAKIESSFTKFYKEADDSWRVVGKDGSIIRLGQVNEAKETSSSGTFSWYLTRVTDTNGNYVEYTYTKDQGKCYLSRIDYTGHENGISPANSVEFLLEPREDIFSSYVSKSKIATAKRLKEIITKVNNALVWRYVLDYVYSPDTNRSLLTSVTQYASDGNALPVQRFVYQKSKSAGVPRL